MWQASWRAFLIDCQLLSRIFELGAYRDINFASSVEAVCQRWYQFADSSPSIWANIVLNTQWTHGLQSFHRKMSQCLARSGAAPLLVDFDLCGIDAVADASALLAAMTPHVSRCYSLAISVPQPEWIGLIGQHFGGALAARMESIALSFKPMSPWTEAYVQSTILQGSMPLLHALALEGLPLTIVNASLPGLRVLKYKQFEETYSYPQNAAAVTPMGDLWHLLRQAPNIEELRVEHSSFSIPEEDIIGSVETKVALNRLKSLTIGHVDAGFAHLLMDAMEAPSLDKLVIRWDPRHCQNTWWIPDHRVTCLSTLVLDGIRILDGSPMVSLTQLLNKAKVLKSLSIKTPATIPTHRRPPPQLFAALSKPSLSGGWLCPELTEFTISQCNSVTGNELLRLVRARERSRDVPGIQFLGIKECAAFDMSTMGELKRRVPSVVYISPPSPLAIAPSPIQGNQ